MIRTPLVFACALAALVSVASACGDDDRPHRDAGTDAGPIIDDAGRPDVGPPPPDAGRGDGNDSFAQAEDLPLGPDGVTRAIQEPRDHDFFSFEGTMGAWMRIGTEANPDDDPMMIDTVITLYDATMVRVAENDDAVPRVNTDSEIIILLPATGTYYVEVQEFSDWAASPDGPEGEPSFGYTLTAFEIDPAAANVLVDPETGDDAASATAARFSMNFGLQLGTFASPTDVDVFSFTVESGTSYVSSNVMPAGDEGYGSTAPVGDIWITDMAGTEIIARVDASVMGMSEVEPPLAPGDYLLWATHGGSASGSNDFYVLKTFTLAMDNTPEAAEATNDDPMTPEALTMMAGDAGLRSGFVRATLGDGDTDHFSFDVLAGEEVAVACGSASSGSGVRGLRVEVLDSTGAVLSMANEAPPMNAFIEDAMVPGAGTYVLKLTKTGQDAEVTGNWVRCGVRAAPPAP